MMKHNLLFTAIFVSLCISCNSHSPSNLTDLQENADIVLTLPSTEIILGQPFPTISKVIHLENTSAEAIYWSEDSTNLFYRIKQTHYAYNISTDVIQMVETPNLVELTEEPNILSQLPAHYRAYVAPSMTKALYVTFADGARPTPTFDPAIEGGEAPDGASFYEFWLWDGVSSIRIATIEICGSYLFTHFWSEDETKFIVGDTGQTSCIGSSILSLLIDLETLSSHALFPRENYFLLNMHGFSPNDKNFLVSYGGDNSRWLLLDVNTLETQPIEAPIAKMVGWISEENLVVMYKPDVNKTSYPIGILNINTLDLRDMTSEFSDEYISLYTLSPDKQWLAFTTGDDWFSSKDLWLLKVD